MHKEDLILGKVITGNPLYDQELELAPWEIKTDHFGRIDCRELLTKTLDRLKQDHALLVLASVDGQRYANTILLDFDRDGLTIDRPNSLDEISVDWLRVYFQDLLGVWSFFQVQARVVGEDLEAIRTTFPEAVYRLRTRRYHRVVVPQGTRAQFREKGQPQEEGSVRDLGAGGMLICPAATGAPIPLDTEIFDIVITLPLSVSAAREREPPPAALPVIKKGRIIRSYLDSADNRLCLGVAFEADAESAEELANSIEIIKDRMLGRG